MNHSSTDVKVRERTYACACTAHFFDGHQGACVCVRSFGLPYPLYVLKGREPQQHGRQGACVCMRVCVCVCVSVCITVATVIDTHLKPPEKIGALSRPQQETHQSVNHSSTDGA